MNISSITHPAVITTSILSSITFISWFRYWYKNNLARTERERAYVCTLLSSITTSTFSLPLVYELLSNRGHLSEVLVYRTWTVLVTTFFMTFLVLDLIIGSIYYKNKIELLTGWIHHITYFFTLTWAIHNQYCSIFVMMCFLEIPTFILALGSVRSQLRRDYVFATTFLMTRILFHSFSIICAYKLKPFGPIMNALSAFLPVHCFWFYGFIKQQLRLARKQTNEKLLSKQELTAKVTTTNTTIKQQENHKTAANTASHLANKSNSVKTTTATIKKAIIQRKTPSSSFHQSPPVSVH